MKVGLIGLGGSGKTTVFNILTGLKADLRHDGTQIHLGVIKVPDPRIDKLVRIFKPRKTTYAEIRFADFPPRETSERFRESAELVSQMRDVDAIVLVLRDFGPDASPLKELRGLLAEMILADLTVVENRLARLKKEKARSHEPELLERCRKTLESEESLRNVSFTPEEEVLLSGFGFLSRKPVLAVFNVADEQAGKSLPPAYQKELERYKIEGLLLAGKVEMEISQLDEADREAFLKELGIQEPARDRFIRAAYRLLDLISFFTTVSDELRAWTVKRGTPARKAAGKIHSDMEQGFIRAEVVAYEDLIALGSEAKCREAGKLRLEGKNYPVQDGDIIHFRFNV